MVQVPVYLHPFGHGCNVVPGSPPVDLVIHFFSNICMTYVVIIYSYMNMINKEPGAPLGFGVA